MQSHLSAPNALAVFINLAHAMEGHPMKSAFRIRDPERLQIVRRKIHFPKRNDDDPFRHPIEVTQLKIPAGKLRVPADSIQQFVDRSHCEKLLASGLLLNPHTRL